MISVRTAGLVASMSLSSAKANRRSVVDAVEPVLKLCYPGLLAPRSIDDPALVRQHMAQERRGRAAGEGAELARQVRLVGVAAGVGQRRQAPSAAALEQAGGVVEAQHPREQLRRHAELAPKADREVLAATAKLSGQRAHTDATGAVLQPPQRPGQVARHRAGGDETLLHEPLQDGQSARMRVGLMQSLDQLVRRGAEEV